MGTEVTAIDDETITHIKAMKKTRYRLNVLAAVKGNNAQDYLADLVEKEYKKEIKV